MSFDSAVFFVLKMCPLFQKMLFSSENVSSDSAVFFLKICPLLKKMFLSSESVPFDSAIVVIVLKCFSHFSS